MNRRRKRGDLPHDQAAILAALAACRAAMIDVVRTTRPGSAAYRAAAGIITAVDGFAEVLTGDAAHFAIGGSVGPGRAEAVKARQREVGTD